jgi:RHS repeat-associated protein
MISTSPTTEDLSLARSFEEPLVPSGAKPTEFQNAALASALFAYSRRHEPDDFSSLTGFLENHPESPWNLALLTNLGLECYKTGHYSKALQAWQRAWQLGKATADLKSKALADRALGELAYMHARLGQMAELEALLEGVEGRSFSGPATEKLTGAREGLSNMQKRPEIAFRCGPFALQRIQFFLDPTNPQADAFYACASSRSGCSLRQVQALSERVGLQFQMAFREHGAAFIVPSVVHLKVNHFAAIAGQEGDRYLLQDTTFGNDVWVTRNALDAEASGYSLIPSGDLITGWRAVNDEEGESIWGKGLTAGNDPGPHGPCDPASPGGNQCGKPAGDCKGMAVPRVHLMLVSLNINDEPVGYSPPVGPAVRFTVRYNQRDARQPGNFLYSNLGPKWTFDWLSYITDQPANLSADLKYYIMGGGERIFTGFNGSQTSAFQQLDQTKLTRTAPDSYEMVSHDGSRKVFSEPFSDPGGQGAIERKVFLSQVIDPHGNAVSLRYDAAFRLSSITDAIGQVTAVSYDHPTDSFKITKVTDPFGRFATFDYDDSSRLIQITDVIGITSQFSYDAVDSDFVTTLTTPYGVTSFSKTEDGTTRTLETTYPDGDRDRVEYNQSTNLGVQASDPAHTVPEGMLARNEFLVFRNTYYWSKQAYAFAHPDYTRAKIYHWLHGRAHVADFNTTAGILESVKEPLEGRVWFDYVGQEKATVIAVGRTNKPTRVGRVLDDGTTQLHTYEYNSFGNVTRQVDPVGRTFSYVYATNGIDLLEVRQTRADRSELLAKKTYSEQHLVLSSADSAGQVTTFTYDLRGLLLSETNAKNETTSYLYDADGRLTSIDGPLPESAIVFTHDALSRVRTKTDESGYTLTFDYDDIDRITKITFPDGTFDEFSYTLLDRTLLRDRAGRETTFEYNAVRQMVKRAAPLNRTTLFQWCKCGALKSMTDPMGRTTTWRHDIQGRIKCKEYADGSRVTYLYEDTMSRLSQRIDEQFQVTQYDYNRDDTLSRITYSNETVPTPPVAFAYDSNFNRLRSMTDGTGTTRYAYNPIRTLPSLGAGQLASVVGPLPDDTITFGYDELGRRISTAINGIAATVLYDAGGRVVTSTNALGVFNNIYDGASLRRTSQSFPNGQTVEFAYSGNLEDLHLQRITNKVGATPISEFVYGRDVPTGQITSWSQQIDEQEPSIFGFAYDSANQLVAASVSAGGIVARNFSYGYDLASNRLTEQVDATSRQFSYNALNELTNVENDSALATTYNWDAEHRLASMTRGDQETQFTYDGRGRRVGSRALVNGAEVSHRRFLWCGDDICEERTAEGSLVKRFFSQGMVVEVGPKFGKYFYTRDHLGSVRELVDNGGSVRARFGYEPYGDQVRIAGDLDSDFGFTGHFYEAATGLCLARHRAYDPKLAQWISRDPMPLAETLQAPSLYTYAANDPINKVDFDGRFPTPYRDPQENCYETADKAFAACKKDGRTSDDCVKDWIAAHEECERRKKPIPLWLKVVLCGVIIFILIPIPKGVPA